MIYRILVNYGFQQFLVPSHMTAAQKLADLRERGSVPEEMFERLARLSRPCPPARAEPDSDEEVLTLAIPGAGPAPRMTGASFGEFAAIMRERGLNVPGLRNPRTRFYFTEAGWREIGRRVAARAHEMGHVVKVLARKNPRASDVVYRDPYQVALLPSSRKRAETRARALRRRLG